MYVVWTIVVAKKLGEIKFFRLGTVTMLKLILCLFFRPVTRLQSFLPFCYPISMYARVMNHPQGFKVLPPSRFRGTTISSPDFYGRRNMVGIETSINRRRL